MPVTISATFDLQIITSGTFSTISESNRLLPVKFKRALVEREDWPTLTCFTIDSINRRASKERISCQSISLRPFVRSRPNASRDRQKEYKTYKMC